MRRGAGEAALTAAASAAVQNRDDALEDGRQQLGANVDGGDNLDEQKPDGQHIGRRLRMRVGATGVTGNTLDACG